MLRKILPFAFIGTFALSEISCKEDLESKIKATPIVVKTIHGQEYKFEEHKVTQVTSDEDDQARYGVISNARGEIKKARAFAQKFKEMGVDGIIVPGDLICNDELINKCRQNVNDKTEITIVLSAIAEAELPVYVIPGNHERKPDYQAALAEVTARYQNIIDMTKFRVYDGDDVDFVSLPGYSTKYVPVARKDPRTGRMQSTMLQLIPDDGYWIQPDFIKATGKLREGLDDSVVLITHGAEKTNTDGKPGPATVYSGKDVGDLEITKMMKDHKIPFAVVGHINEAGGLAATHEGKLITLGEWAPQFTVNFGGLEQWQHLTGKIYEGMAGILTVKGDQATFEMYCFTPTEIQHCVF